MCDHTLSPNSLPLQLRVGLAERAILSHCPLEFTVLVEFLIPSSNGPFRHT